MPRNDFTAISPVPWPWFTERKGWQAVVHGNHLRKRCAALGNGWRVSLEGPLYEMDARENSLSRCIFGDK